MNKPETPKMIKFNGVECTLAFNEYENGNTAILLMEGGTRYAVATLNDPELELEADQILIKDYSENEGMVKALQDAKIVQPLYPHPVGTFGASTWVCKLNTIEL